MVTESQKEAIRKEAREILESFAKTLEKAKVPAKKEDVGGEGVRKEGNGMKCDDDFRKRMFENAPRKDKDCIIAEKGAWT
ncbi:MAG TPA: hypothetical protein VJK07_00045 [Candidatus Nanoarchaeia archaeon]|nr:hypothetical protein [Candidatus Nanoarchaeia archaeon]